MTPRHALAWLWLSRGYALLNRSTDAAQAFARGEQLNPDLAAAFGGGAK
jgi:cytochrome c-type biogenesis protein CcmH/NrfG